MSTSSVSAEQPWGQCTLTTGERLQWAVRDLRIWLERAPQAWWLCWDRPDTARLVPMVERVMAEDEAELPGELSPGWRRWAFGEERPGVYFRPAVPDRPLLVKTEPACIVPPGCRATFFLAVPVWVAVAIPSPTSPDELRDLVVVPSEALSSTWFGDLSSGVLCWALRSTARMSAAELSRDPLTAVCAFTVFNQSSEDLPMNKICLEASHLGIYQSRDRLWTNEVYVAVKGSDLPNRVRFSKGAPKGVGETTSLRPPEKENDDNPLKRTFSFGR